MLRPSSLRAKRSNPFSRLPRRPFGLLAMTLVILFVINPSFAEKPADIDNKKIAKDLAECGGIFDAMGNVLINIGKEKAGQTYQDTARGAYMGAAYLEHMTGEIPKWENAISWSENLKIATSNYWLGLLELHTSSTEEPFPSDFMDELHFCTSLNPIQTELVNMMRETIYSQK